MLWSLLFYLLFASACLPGIGVQPRCCNVAKVQYCGCDGLAPAEFMVTLSGCSNAGGLSASILNDTFVVVKREGCAREGDPADWCCYSHCLDNPDEGAELGGGSCGPGFPPGDFAGPKLLIVLWLKHTAGSPGSLAFYELRVHTIYAGDDLCCDPPYLGCSSQGFLEGSFLGAAPDADCAAVDELELDYSGRTCYQYDLTGATCTISAA